MPLLLAAVLLVAVELGPGFDGAEVTGTETSAATMEIEVTVGVSRSRGPVIAHLIAPGSAPEMVPLVDRSAGRWGAIIEVRRADWRVVFEDVPSGALSEEVSLTELGLDPALLGSVTSARPAPDPTQAPTWLWLGVAVVAGGAAVAVTRLGRVSVSPRHLRRRPRSRRSASS